MLKIGEKRKNENENERNERARKNQLNFLFFVILENLSATDRAMLWNQVGLL